MLASLDTPITQVHKVHKMQGRFTNSTIRSNFNSREINCIWAPAQIYGVGWFILMMLGQKMIIIWDSGIPFLCILRCFC